MSEQQDRTIWCGNLPRELKDEHLYELFLQAGPLERVHRPKDRTTGQPREFAFITYEDEESVPYALEIYQGTQLYGQTIRMQPRGRVKEAPQLSRSNSLPMMPAQNHHHHHQQQWQQQEQPSNEAMMRQMAARQMMMMATQQAQQVAMAQRFPQFGNGPWQQPPGPWQQPGPWRQPPPFPPNFHNFGPYGGGGGGGGRGRHHRSQSHRW